MTILLIGYSMAWQQVIGDYRGDDDVTFVEEPDVVRKRDVRGSRGGADPACELVEWEYQRAGAADRFYLAHRDLRPAAIVPVVEYAVPFAARLAERYGVTGAGATAAELLCNKAPPAPGRRRGRGREPALPGRPRPRTPCATSCARTVGRSC